MAISKSKLPARDVCERSLRQIQRAIRTPTAVGVQSATERSEALGASLWLSGQNLVSECEQQILGTATEDCHSRKRLRNDKILLCLLLIET